MISNSNFIHLHVHSDCSILTSCATIEQLIEKAKRLNMPSLAITETGNMFSAVKFYNLCRENNIKPIIGQEFYFADGSSLVLLCENEKGYKNLSWLSSRSFCYENTLQNGKPTINFELLKQYHEGLVCLSGGFKGEITQTLLNEKIEKAYETAKQYKELFGENHFYIELQNHGLAKERTVAEDLVRLAQDLNIQLVATNNIHYLEREDAETWAALQYIGSNKKLYDLEEKICEEKYFNSKTEIEKSLSEIGSLDENIIKEAIENTIKIGDMCNFEISKYTTQELKDCLPKLNIPIEFKNQDEYLRYLVEEGLKKRYKEITPKIHERAENEMQIIFSKGFSGYYLFTWEFVTWAKSNWDNVNNKPKPYIAVGPGRSSDAGSLVAYCIGITDVNPIKHGLLFERFINPERDCIPDFDIDVDYYYRDEVIQHLRDLYGKDCVGRIVTFAKTQKKRGLHACGVVISKTALPNWMPVFVDEKTKELATQYSMDMLEQCGLVKFDILGLKTLSFISKMENEIRKKTGNSEFKISDIDENDKETFELFRRGDTKGVFQFESLVMQEYLKQLNSVCMEDLIALNALYRPGIMDYIPKFIEGKNNPDTVKYPLHCLEEILNETYGIIVYQEQFMLIGKKIAGYSLAESDFFRRDLGKKKNDVILARKKEFEDGAAKNGYNIEEADEIFELLLKFSGYAFNKAHAAAYSKLAYQTAWLKCHYPEEFSCLYNDMNKEITGK